jgi:hypothetical protein
MSFLKLQFRQGLNRDQTNYTGEGGWWDGDKIRFFSGYPQKIGGWLKSTSETFIGTCRQMFNYITSFTDNFLAVGTNQKVYIEVGGIFYDITPLRETFTTSTSPSSDNCIDTTDTLTTVNVNITGHGCLTGDYVTISGVTGDPGGIPDAEINAEHVVTKVDADNFTFEVTTAATSTTSNQGGTAITVECQIHPGFASITAGYGWGTGAWNGSYGWGLASPTPVYLPQRDWFFDNFDNDLVMNIRADTLGSGVAVGGPIYYWERGSTLNPSTALATRAVLLSSLVGATDVPESATQILVSQNDKHLLAFGCQPYGGSSGDFDPLLIRWASQDDPLMWEPLATNTAGFIRVSRGSRIVRAIPNRQEILVLTDASLYSLQFLGTTDVFGLQELADNISIISPRAVTTTNNITYWMGVDKFYMYDGRVKPLPTTVREYVFKDINFGQADQVISGTNEGFNEVWWFYPSAASNWVDRYVIYNYLDNCWYYGNLVRTAWLDTPLRPYPYAASTPSPADPVNDPYNQDPGVLYQHEFGVNDDELPMECFIQSNDFDIQQNDGETFMLTRRMIPDINFRGSTAQAPEVTLTVRSRNFPGSQYQTDPSDNQRVIETSFGLFTNQVFVRARGRQLALKVASDDLGVQWQLGSPRLDVRPDGKQ